MLSLNIKKKISTDIECMRYDNNSNFSNTIDLRRPTGAILVQNAENIKNSAKMFYPIVEAIRFTRSSMFGETVDQCHFNRQLYLLRRTKRPTFNLGLRSS